MARRTSKEVQEAAATVCTIATCHLGRMLKVVVMQVAANKHTSLDSNF